MRIAMLLTMASVAVMSTVAVAQSVTYDFDRAANFSRFKTYAWVRGTNLSDDLNHRRVMRAVETQLASKGLAQVDPAARPDVLVAYHASFDRALQIDAFSTGWGPLGLGGNRTGRARAQQVLVGTLVVDMSDASTRSVVWRAAASMDVDAKASPEKREKNITKAAEKLFKHYPTARAE